MGLFLIAYAARLMLGCSDVRKLRNTDIEVEALMGRSDTGGSGYENTRCFKCACFDQVSSIDSTPPIGDYSSTNVEGGRASDITSGVTRRGQWGACAPRGTFFWGRHFDILFHTMTQIAHNHGKCRGKVGKNIKMS